jgi:dihydroorotase
VSTPLLLRNVRLTGSTGNTDLLIGANGKLAAVGAQLQVPKDARVIDQRGAYLSPSWVDLHTHIYWGATDVSVRARDIGAATGVGLLVDAGSAGEANFKGFREYVAEASREQIVAFLNIGSIGLVACNRVSELIDQRASIDIDRTFACIDANRDIIRGVKVRASGVIVGGWGITPVKIAKRVARVSNLPLMVHVGEMPPTPEEVLDLLEPGDIITHCFHGKRGGNIMEDPALFDYARRLQEQGVILDLGHGAASFNYAVGRHSLERGLLPTTISSDLHDWNINGPVWDLSMVMSKMLALGMPFDAVVNAVGSNPRKALRMNVSAPFAVGARADFTAFQLVDCDLTLPDADGNPLKLPRRFAPRWTILGTEAIPAASRYVGQPTMQAAGAEAAC